ncbi:DUF7266 family protein [Halobaculum magnesiiphilum]|uniref:Uncharacterized protein n=1 Tax=Halobaculum magnesiiphilum TaxID=1017351 RepID=A0A8T8WAK0_9EURY|nr:hypothetical protein [Halobaculum magnesiiphilum]QZP36889.1 hypothetical protein K6T50_11365 [Halobaculum magnesiiphilum]
MTGRRPIDASARSDGRRERAVTPVVSKTLEIGLVVLFVGGLSTALFGGAVPDYRDAAADRVADRALAGAATEIEIAVPPRASSVRVERRVDIPATIRGTGYRIVAADGAVRLDHPNPSVGGSLRLALPDRVASVSGAWRSGAETVVTVAGGDGRLSIELVSR